ALETSAAIACDRVIAYIAGVLPASPGGAVLSTRQHRNHLPGAPERGAARPRAARGAAATSRGGRGAPRRRASRRRPAARGGGHTARPLDRLGGGRAAGGVAGGAARVTHLVTIAGIAAGGDGVGRLADGRAVFVPRTAPGDRVVLRPGMQLHKRFARGEVAEVATPGPARVAPPCPHFARD